MKNKDLEKLIYDMLIRQNRLMVGKIMPDIERLYRVDDLQEHDLSDLKAAVLALGQDTAMLAEEIYKLKTGKSLKQDPHGEPL